MSYKLPKADHAEIERAAKQIAAALEANFEWHENFHPTMRTKQVKTNVGVWAYFGLLEMVPIEGTVFTKRVPTARVLLAVSSVPTSGQKVVLVEAITTRIAQLLRVPQGTETNRYDPTTQVEDVGIKLGQVRAENERKLLGLDAVEVDPYKHIKVPFSLTMNWPEAPEEGPKPKAA